MEKRSADCKKQNFSVVLVGVTSNKKVLGYILLRDKRQSERMSDRNPILLNTIPSSSIETPTTPQATLPSEVRKLF